jgi:hypothetical protein
MATMFGWSARGGACLRAKPLHELRILAVADRAAPLIAVPVQWVDVLGQEDARIPPEPMRRIMRYRPSNSRPSTVVSSPGLIELPLIVSRGVR